MKNKFFAGIVSAMAGAVLCVIGACIPQTADSQTESVPPDDAAQLATPAALPMDIPLTSPLAQVIRLTQAGVSENVIMTYITNSSGMFNLDSDKIIYLSDLGTPDEFITAMMQHDQTLAASGVQPVSPPETVPADTTEVAAQPPPTEIAQTDFDDTLAPYGSWVDVDGYGRCWRPTATFYDTGWQPYCDHGHWIYTDNGWYWASDYSWGVTFHYGRWFRDARLGWCWWPDTTWAPSWVAWRYSDDYCGWAPLPPRTVYREGVGIFYNGVAVSANFDFGLSVDFFTFVPTRNFYDPHPSRYRAAPLEVAQIYNRTTVINNFGVNSHDRTFANNGIPPQQITAVTRTEIHPVAIRETTTPVAHGEQLGRDGSTLFVNRPHFADHPNSASTQGFTPRAATLSPEQSAPRATIVHENGVTPAGYNPPPPQNNFSQPMINRNSQLDYNRPALQTQPAQSAQPETPRSTVQHQTPAQNSAPGAPFETPAADFNSYQPIQAQPRQQPAQTGTPHTFTHNPEPPQNADAPPQNQIVAPAANHFAAPQEQPPQHNFTPRQNDSSFPDSRPSRNEPPPIIIQPQAPAAQTPAATTQPSQKNSGRWDKNQNGQQQ
jgi:hypothetical protein